MEIQANYFANGVHNGLGGLDGLRQASPHPDMEHGEAWETASIVHVRVPEKLLADAVADLLLTEGWPWICHTIFGLRDEERRLGSARRQ